MCEPSSVDGGHVLQNGNVISAVMRVFMARISSTFDRCSSEVNPSLSVPIISSFAEWRKPNGGSTRVVVVGIDKESGGLEPWNLIHGSWEDIRAPDAIGVDVSYLKDLGIEGVGSTAQISVGRVKVRALTEGIRSFTQSPYVFTTLQRARNLLNLDGDRGDRSTFFFNIFSLIYICENLFQESFLNQQILVLRSFLETFF